MIHDDCDVGLMCADFDGLGSFICVELCSGTTLVPSCSSPNEACTDAASSGCSASVCRVACDPIAQDCPTGQACFVEPGSFGKTPVCVPAWTWDAELGEPCSAHLLDTCAPGLLCGDGPLLGCIPTDFTGCCAPLCELDQQDCAAIEEGLSCQSFDPGYEPIGMCATP